MAENATPTAPEAHPPESGQAEIGGEAPDRLLSTESARARPREDDAQRGERRGRAQAHRRGQDLPEKRAIYLALIGLFFGVFVAFSARAGRGKPGQRPPIRPFDVGLLAMATYRLARIVSFDQVAEPIRAPLAESTPGGGTEPKGHGARKALGELIACPLCLGVWISAGLTYGMLILPIPTRVFATIFAAAGIAEFLNYVVSLVDSANRLVMERRNRLAGDA